LKRTKEGVVRKITVIGLIVLALGALAVIVPAKAAQTASGDHRVPRPRQLTAQSRQLAPHLKTSSDVSVVPQAATDAFVFNNSFVTRTFNHFGNPANGSVIAETWGEDGITADGVEQNTQGISRAILLPKALRVSLQTRLIGFSSFDDQTGHLVASSSTINSAGKLTVQAATPEISLSSSPDCFFLTTVHMGIRWSDSRLSTVDFSMDFAYPNVQNDSPSCLPPQ
jgi:hypothetical protein